METKVTKLERGAYRVCGLVDGKETTFVVKVDDKGRWHAFNASTIDECSDDSNWCVVYASVIKSKSALIKWATS